MNRSIVLAIGLLAFLPFDTALAGDHPQTLPGWHPEPFSDFTLAAGTFCPFAVHVDILKNDAIGTIPTRFPDGKPEKEVLMGPMRLRVSNADRVKSTITYIDGILIYDYATDGTFTVTAIGKNVVGFTAGDGFPAGYYFIDGYHVIHYTPNGTSYTRRMVSAIGIQTSYCRTLT